MTIDDSSRVPYEELMTSEESRYALGQRVGVCVGLAMLVAVFCIHVFGLVPPKIPLEELPQYWDRPSKEFVKDDFMPDGWEWTGRLGEGDVLTILPAVFLAAVTGFCLAATLPIHWRKRDWAYVVIILLQLAVFVVASLPGVGVHR